MPGSTSSEKVSIIFTLKINFYENNFKHNQTLYFSIIMMTVLNEI